MTSLKAQSQTLKTNETVKLFTVLGDNCYSYDQPMVGSFIIRGKAASRRKLYP